MAKVNPNSKASRLRRADALLRALLRSPKTQAGLIAAAQTKGVSKHYVYGWITHMTRIGDVVVLKSTSTVTYQMANVIAEETARPGVFPSWLEPRVLPSFHTRTAFLDGKSVRLSLR